MSALVPVQVQDCLATHGLTLEPIPPTDKSATNREDAVWAYQKIMREAPRAAKFAAYVRTCKQTDPEEAEYYTALFQAAAALLEESCARVSVRLVPLKGD